MKKNIINNFFNQGYCIINLFNKSQVNKIKNDIVSKINFLIKDSGKKIKKHELQKYHKIKHIEKIHSLAIKNSSRYINLENKIKKKIYLNKEILNLTNIFWGHSKFKIKWIGSLKKNNAKNNAMAFRIARPKNSWEKDVGGEHIDLNYGGNVRPNNYKFLLTIWCPLIGYSKKYTLRFSPKSHLKKHPKNAISKQKKYISQVFKKNYLKGYKFIRPNLKPGQAILFHPNLIHGASHNRGNQTRVSVELRIFNNKVLGI